MPGLVSNSVKNALPKPKRPLIACCPPFVFDLKTLKAHRRPHPPHPHRPPRPRPGIVPGTFRVLEYDP
ncbi:hypothetical protein GKZ68_19415 [Hymenobacter sp. BRD128]|uniref:hypothetical protein n=1 Tax=Hymenobacter sp. BRD128 TaxID=2675878 RepID=UPI00156636DB|nr:hypothetical protein [Hymenobacter sp. BRD128]QKG58607.1 hypothetical protein GKZ68_19415 [Hymenobacter sp. BRD128]